MLLRSNCVFIFGLSLFCFNIDCKFIKKILKLKNNIINFSKEDEHEPERINFFSKVSKLPFYLQKTQVDCAP